MNLNIAIVAGNLTRDPELRALPSGGRVITFCVATNRRWKQEDGTTKDFAEFHNVVGFGVLAATCGQYLKKGQQVIVTGRLQTRSWEDQSGVKHYKTEIVAGEVQFGPRVASSQNDTGSGLLGAAAQTTTTTPQPPTSQSTEAAVASPVYDPIPQIEYPTEEINPADIPF